MLLIKKYPNRRLYNTEISSYTSLNDLFIMIKDGIEFKVIDSKTNEDITHNMLTQIIFDQEARGYKLLPLEFLKQIIRCYSAEKANFLPFYLEQVMNNFSNIHENFQKLFPSTTVNMLEDVSNKNIAMINKSFDLLFKSFNFQPTKQKNE